MLRCSNVCLRYLGAGVRLGSRCSTDSLLNTTSLPRTRFGPCRKFSSSATKPSLFNGEVEDAEPSRGPSRFRRNDTDSNESVRNIRLAKSLDHAYQRRRMERKKVRGNKEEVALLMDLAKTRALPEGVNPTVVSKELQWLADPKDLAMRVASLLSGGQAPLAVAMIRKAESKRMVSIGAWNSLLNYCFKQGAPLAAFKFYNDMKKRGRMPNERTYSAMLRGFCLQSRQSGVKHVELAYRIYKQLLSKDTEAIPNHFHHHAMIDVCGNHHDMETLWNVIGDLPEAGDGRPNAHTFTSILIALRNCYTHEIESIPEDKMKAREEKRKELLIDAKRIWADVINEWRRSDLEIDHSLVSAMASVLSDPLDELNSYNVLALFNQTMGIPIYLPKPKASSKGSKQGTWEAAVRSSKDRPNYTPWRSTNSASTDIDNSGEKRSKFTPWRPSDSDTDSTEALQALDEEERELIDSLENVFDPLDKSNSNELPPLLKPNAMALNQILTVCRILSQGATVAKRYWNLFTLDKEGYNVEPDEGNYHELLRLLRAIRASHDAVEMIRRQMTPAGYLEGKTFHIAMSCCLRDRANPNVLLNAQALLDIMKENLPLPEPRALKSFIDLSDALTDNPQWLLGLKGLEPVDQSTTNLTMMGRNMRWALHKKVIMSLEPHIDRLYEAMESRLESKRPLSAATPVPDSVHGAIAVSFMVKVRQMLDQLLSSQYEGILTESDREWITPIALKLRKFSRPEVAIALEVERIRPLPRHYATKQTEST